MYFYNARLKFKVPPLGIAVPGSVIAASAISAVDLQKRRFADHPHLRRRLLDPQLYVARIDPALDRQAVARLAAYPWFHGREVPKYDSGQYSNRRDWKKKHESELISRWTRGVPSGAEDVSRAARAAVEFQVAIGCEAIILPGPLTAMDDQTLTPELQWVDAGIDACRSLNVNRPIFATIAISEAVLHVAALRNPLVHSLSNIVSSRGELAGAYIVLEQSEAGLYFWNAKDPLMSLLVLVDDLCRGARKRVIVNYVGTFGLVAACVGAEIWSTGYYLMQRRFSLRGESGRAHPRYHSLTLAGDVGLGEDMVRIRAAGLLDQVLTSTAADVVLESALRAGRTPDDVPEWAYKQSNVAAAQRHYLELVSRAAELLEPMPAEARNDWLGTWLHRAVDLAQALRQAGIVGSATTTEHQRVWLDVFEEWRNYATQ